MIDPNTENNKSNNENSLPDFNFSQIRDYFFSFVKDIIDLKKGVDKKGTIEEIKNKKSLAGANAWMLMCSIMIASLGLDRNSPAVIIGAMLISPLMSPILGLGLGVGINDRNVIRQSMVHFTAAIFIALFVSTLYFLLTPLGTLTSEIEARTSPTILDVMIAFFGGIAGIISYARKDISTTIPGVAIATALMPPLCVTGYGIANMNLDIIFSSFYLFFSNTFFIVLSTYMIVRLLEFPYTRYVNKKDIRRNRYYVIFFSLLVAVPSFFIMRNVIGGVSTDIKVVEFINLEFGKDKKYLDDYLAIQSDTLNELILKVYGRSNITYKTNQYQRRLDSLGLKDWKVTILPTSEVNLERVKKLETQFSDVNKMFSTLDSLENLKTIQESSILDLQEKLQFGMLDSTYFEDVCRETKAKFPLIEEMAIGSIPYQNFSDSIRSQKDIVIVKWKPEVQSKQFNILEENLTYYLEGSLKKDSIIIFRNQ